MSGYFLSDSGYFLPDISLFRRNVLFHPTEADVHTVRKFLLSFEILPLELVDIILELAEYWPHVYVSTDVPLIKVEVIPGNVSNAATALCVLTPPIPAHDGNIQVRAVKFVMESHDQGWTSDPENGARTWFQASIIRVPKSAHPPDWPDELEHTLISLDDCKKNFDLSQVRGEGGCEGWHVQTNVMASKQKQLYQVVWTPDSGSCTATVWHGGELQTETTVIGEKDKAWTDEFKGRMNAPKEFVERLQRGDRVALIAKARCLWWCNYVYNASVEIIYSM